MGISTNVYTIFGVKAKWNDEFFDTYDEVYDDKDNPYVLFGEEYMIFGKMLFDSGDFRWGLENGDSFKEIDINTLPDVESSYRAKFKEKFPDFYNIIEDKPFKLFTLTHYS